MAHVTGITIASAWRGGASDGRPGWRVDFRYSADAVEAFKAAIPAAYREWMPMEMCWWIDLAYEAQAKDRLRAFEGFTRQLQMEI